MSTAPLASKSAPPQKSGALEIQPAFADDELNHIVREVGAIDSVVGLAMLAAAGDNRPSLARPPIGFEIEAICPGNLHGEKRRHCLALSLTFVAVVRSEIVMG